LRGRGRGDLPNHATCVPPHGGIAALKGTWWARSSPQAPAVTVLQRNYTRPWLRTSSFCDRGRPLPATGSVTGSCVAVNLAAARGNACQGLAQAASTTWGRRANRDGLGCLYSRRRGASLTVPSGVCGSLASRSSFGHATRRSPHGSPGEAVAMCELGTGPSDRPASAAGNGENSLRVLLLEVQLTRARHARYQVERGASTQTLLPVRRAALRALENYSSALRQHGWPTPPQMKLDIQLLRALCGIQSPDPSTRN
jgi:hypothetical protein